MYRFIVIFFILFVGLPKEEITPSDDVMISSNYSRYHLRVMEAEEFITSDNYKAALDIYQTLFRNYSFVFVREYKIATQLAVSLDKKDVALGLLKDGILSGWDKKSIRKNRYLSEFIKGDEAKKLMEAYTDLH